METKAGRAKAGRAKTKREPELVREREQAREQGMQGAGAWLEAMVGLGKLELRLPG